MEKEITKTFIIDYMKKTIEDMENNNYDIETICGAKQGFEALCKVLGICPRFLFN